MAMEQMSLDDVLKNVERPTIEKAPAEPAAAAEPAAPVTVPAAERSSRKAHAEKEARARGEDGKFVPAEQKEADKPAATAPAASVATPAATPAAPAKPAQPEFTEKERALLFTAQEERRKRQEVERLLAEIRAGGANAAPAPKPEEPKSFWDDPEGKLTAMERSIEQRFVRSRLETSEFLARSKYPDYQEKLNAFIEMSRGNQPLYHQMLQASDPAEFVYRMAKNQKELSEVGSLDALKERIEKETRAKVETEVREKIKKEQDEAKAKADALPGSLSNVTGTGASTRVAWAGPKSFDDILKP